MVIKYGAKIETGKVCCVAVFEDIVGAGYVDVTSVTPRPCKNWIDNGDGTYTPPTPPTVGRITITPAEINLGESATVEIRAEVSKADSTLRPFNGTRNITVSTPEGVLVRPKFTFVNGVANKVITPHQAGLYTVQPLLKEKEVQLVGTMILDVLTP